jgi:hypothetical protein
MPKALNPMIELVVSMAIFATITSIIMVSQRRFGGNITITNLAYDIALAVRQAQVYGISVKRATQVSDVAQQFNLSYGVHFKSTDRFVVFTDINGDGLYDTLADDGLRCVPAASIPFNHYPECVTVYRIQAGSTITGFCGGTDCAGGNIDSLDILFHRPNPEPTINGSKAGIIISSHTNASVTVTSSEGLVRNVMVSGSGQISIQ